MMIVESVNMGIRMAAPVDRMLKALHVVEEQAVHDGQVWADIE